MSPSQTKLDALQVLAPKLINGSVESRETVGGLLEPKIESSLVNKPQGCDASVELEGTFSRDDLVALIACIDEHKTRGVFDFEPPKFKMLQVLVHLKTQGEYIVKGLPDQYVLEGTREPAYAYVKAHPLPGDRRIFLRCQSEMEDGRFLPLAEFKKRVIPATVRTEKSYDPHAR